MDGKKTIHRIILLYIVVGALAVGIGVYAQAQGVDGSLLTALSSNIQENKSEEETEVPEEEPEELFVEEEPDELEQALADAHKEDDKALEESLEEDLTKESEEELLDMDEEEEVFEEETKKASEETSVLREGPYYQYTITSDFDLNMYSAPDTPNGTGVIGVIPKGTKGYVIGQSARRTLIEYEGSYAYVSNTYVSLSEVSEDEYPSDLKNVTMDNVVISEE